MDSYCILCLFLFLPVFIQPLNYLPIYITFLQNGQTEDNNSTQFQSQDTYQRIRRTKFAVQSHLSRYVTRHPQVCGETCLTVPPAYEPLVLYIPIQVCTVVSSLFHSFQFLWTLDWWIKVVGLEKVYTCTVSPWRCFKWNKSAEFLGTFRVL